MKQALCFFFLAFSMSPSARAEMYHYCGCISTSPDIDKTNRDNWEFFGNLNKARAKQGALAACRQQFGRRAALLTNCVQGRLTDLESERVHLQEHLEREERRPAPRRRRNDPVVIGPSPLDEVIRRNREDELNLVLKEARDCRMYGICPGR